MNNCDKHVLDVRTRSLGGCYAVKRHPEALCRHGAHHGRGIQSLRCTTPLAYAAAANCADGNPWLGSSYGNSSCNALAHSVKYERVP